MAASPAAFAFTDVQAGTIQIQIGDQRITLSQIEEHYLAALYAECNRVKLIVDEAPDERFQPRLQRIYVDLHTTESPSLYLFGRRLGLAETDPKKLLNQVWHALPKGELTAPTDNRDLATLWREPLSRLDDESLEKSAQTLGVSREQLQAALTNFSVLEVVHEVPRFVLLGDPGGGKSTLTQRLAGVLASSTHKLDEVEQGWLAETVSALGRWLLPVRIVLSRWAKEIDSQSKGVADDLIDQCVRLIGDAATVSGLKDDFINRLRGDTPSVLLLLDGLDEVVDEKRPQLLKAIRHFLDSYPHVPLILTCRIRPWQGWSEGKNRPLPLPVYTLDRLDNHAIANFLQRWYSELVYARIYDTTAAEVAHNRLLNAIQSGRRPELAEMAGTPLLLTMMARVNYKKGLPGSRAALYEEYVSELLWEWERRKQNDLGEESSLHLLLRRYEVREENSLSRALSRLAYEIHDRRRSGQDTVDITRSDLRTALERICPGDVKQKAAWALDLLALLDERSGLINCLDNRDPEERIYQFSHRTFQEYLAARWMADENPLGKFKSRIDQENWREAIFLALGYLISVRGQYHTALTLFDELLSEEAAADLNFDERWWRRVLLLGEGYTRLLGEQKASEVEEKALFKRVTQRIPHLLTSMMQDRAQPTRNRLEAGLLLSDLNIDPPGLDSFIEIPGLKLQIGKYPVTNKQFRRFVDDDGYEEQGWWSEEGWSERQEGNWSEPRYWNDDRFNHSNQPVVGVTWYEAEAYCNWRSAQLGIEVRLPSEAEWLAAAHASQQEYPWGNGFDLTRANTKESDLQQTTPVDMYQDGATAEGVYDLSGNVWEWSQDVDTDGWPWLKGGSWYDNGDSAKSSARLRDGPYFRNVDLGFRCVCVPISR
ncbi:MAG: SUMF1/EgtB/PvdO family nonheme iron enzyme [Caldilineaceae bacterium]